MKRQSVPGLVRLVGLVAGCCGQASCLSLLFEGPSVKSQGYVLEPPPLPWHKIDAGTADLAFQRSDDRSTISLNSVCGQYQDQTLEDLTKSVGLGLTDSRVATVEKLDMDGSPALKTTVEGNLQSASVTVSLIVLRSTQCVYDFMLVARRESFLRHERAVADLVSGFREGTKP